MTLAAEANCRDPSPTVAVKVSPEFSVQRGYPVPTSQMIKPYGGTGIALRFSIRSFHFVLNVLLAMVL